jgi:hypothetical protein
MIIKSAKAANPQWSAWELRSVCEIEVKKVLKPEVYQEFPLKEKTVLSHNVAM